MANMLFALPITSDGATVTCSESVAAGLPLTNLWTTSLVEVARILATSASITVDLGSAASIRAVLLLTNNVRTTATWTVSAATSEGGLASPAFTTGSLSVLDPLSPAIFATQSYRWWRIAIDDTGNPDGYLDIARLYISTAWVPATNAAPYSLRWEDLSVQRNTRGGQIAVAARQKRRVVEFALQYQTEADAWDEAYELLKSRGGSEDIIVVLDPDNSGHVQRQAVYGLLTEIPALQHAVPAADPANALWEVGPWRLTELIP